MIAAAGYSGTPLARKFRIFWPRRASGGPTGITEDVIRDAVLPIGPVDVKVAAVNDIWSGWKLVIRKELR